MLFQSFLPPTILRTAAAILALAGGIASAVEPFFAPAIKAGSIEVRLHPTEGVSGARLVTFGVPFTRGSLAPRDLSKVRILKNGEEIPARVDVTATWRQALNPALDGASVRVVRIQLRTDLHAVWPDSEVLTVAWGGPERARPAAEWTDPRAGWHAVTSGTFAAGDGVFEPDVLVVLPKAHLSLGTLKPVRFHPLADAVPEAREDPAAMEETEHWPGYEELDHAAHNFFLPLINSDDPRVTAANLCPYREDSEPWLYDRASVMFTHYFRSGHVRVLREAIRAAEFYRSKLYPRGTDPERAVGLFKLKIPDPLTWADGNGAMYSYNECLAYQYWLTGDASVLPAIDDVVSAHEHNDESSRWSPGETSWTERHTAFHLLADVVAYEVTGSSASRSNLLRQVSDFIWHQNGAGGALPANRVDGGLYHFGRQHGDGAEDALVASSWMTVLTADAMLRAFAVTEDPAIADFIRRLGTFWKASCKFDLVHQYDTYDGPLWSPDYMMNHDGTSDPREGRDYAMVEHAADVASGLAWSGYFASLSGKADPTLFQTATNLYFTYDIGVNYWTRPAAPASGRTAFRLSPWRKYGWEHRLSGSLGWVLPQLLAASATRPELGLQRAATGGLQLTFGGGAGVWRVESATALDDWSTWMTLTNRNTPLAVPLAGGDSRRFFRAVQP